MPKVDHAVSHESETGAPAARGSWCSAGENERISYDIIANDIRDVLIDCGFQHLNDKAVHAERRVLRDELELEEIRLRQSQRIAFHDIFTNM